MGRNKKDLVERIVEIEAEMFLQVPTDTEPPCRSRVEDMKLHRRVQFAGWAEHRWKDTIIPKRLPRCPVYRNGPLTE